MKRKDLKVGETYYVNNRRGAKDDIFNFRSYCSVPEYGSTVIAVEPYEEQTVYSAYKLNGKEYVEVSSGTGVLVEQNYLWQGKRASRRIIVNLSSIICPLEEAVTQIRKNKEHRITVNETGKRLLAEREKYEAEVLTPCLNALTTALKKLQERVDGTPKHFDGDTRLGSMSLDVIETLTLIIEESLSEKVGA